MRFILILTALLTAPLINADVFVQGKYETEVDKLAKTINNIREGINSSSIQMARKFGDKEPIFEKAYQKVRTAYYQQIWDSVKENFPEYRDNVFEVYKFSSELSDVLHKPKADSGAISLALVKAGAQNFSDLPFVYVVGTYNPDIPDQTVKRLTGFDTEHCVPGKSTPLKGKLDANKVVVARVGRFIDSENEACIIIGLPYRYFESDIAKHLTADDFARIALLHMDIHQKRLTTDFRQSEDKQSPLHPSQAAPYSKMQLMWDVVPELANTSDFIQYMKDRERLEKLEFRLPKYELLLEAMKKDQRLYKVTVNESTYYEYFIANEMFGQG